MQTKDLESDKTIRLDADTHHSLRLLSVRTGLSIKGLVRDAVPLLVEQRGDLEATNFSDSVMNNPERQPMRDV